MEKKIIKLPIYGDHRDIKSGIYEYKLNFKEILYNLTEHDASFIFSVLYKNVLDGEEISKGFIYDKVDYYNIMERGTEILCNIVLSSTRPNYKQKTLFIDYDYSTNYLNITLGHNFIANASEVIMIYEYLKSIY